jgi:hypothetical protein
VEDAAELDAWGNQMNVRSGFEFGEDFFVTLRRGRDIVDLGTALAHQGPGWFLPTVGQGIVTAFDRKIVRPRDDFEFFRQIVQGLREGQVMMDRENIVHQNDFDLLEIGGEGGDEKGAVIIEMFVDLAAVEQGADGFIFGKIRRHFRYWIKRVAFLRFLADAGENEDLMPMTAQEQGLVPHDAFHAAKFGPGGVVEKADFHRVSP